MKYIKLSIDDARFCKIQALADSKYTSVTAIAQCALDLYLETGGAISPSLGGAGQASG